MSTLNPLIFAGQSQDGSIQQPYQSIFEASEFQKYALGTEYKMADGRKFRYAKAGSTALVQARMHQSAAYSTTDHYCEQVQTGYTRSVGDTNIRVLVTTGNVASAAIGAAENDFAGGFLVCNKVSPAVLGDIYGIVASKHYSETLLDLQLATPWRNAMLATGEISLIPNKFMKTVVFAAYDATAQAVGIPLCAVPANYYYWSQVKGIAPLLVDGSETLDVGQIVGCPITLGTAGDGGAQIVTTAEVLRRPWGTCVWIGVDSEPALVDLQLE